MAGVFLTFTSTGPHRYMSHAHCYLFNRNLMLLHGGSDLLIGMSYVGISASLVVLVFLSRRALPFHWMMLAFASFIVACGATHFMELWTLLDPDPKYWLAGWIKLITAIASVVTAVLLPQLIAPIVAILHNARLAEARHQELEKACLELQLACDSAAEPGTPPLPGPEEGRLEVGNLASLAKRITRYTRELQEARKIAEEANCEKDRFLAILSHELRSPLMPALAAASDLESAPDVPPEELKSRIGLIRRNIELEARLVDDLLDTNRLSRGQLALREGLVDVHECVQHAGDMCLQSAAQRGVHLHFALEALDRHIQGDAARISQIFWNLILNAIKFSPSATGIVLVTSRNPEPGKIEVRVADNGAGIAPDLLAEIFKPFHQGGSAVARQLGGLGLGLFIAQGLVAAHRGVIRAHSAGLGRGAEFSVELPTVCNAAAPARGGHASGAGGMRPLRILIAEDHEDTCFALDRLLRRLGHEVRIARTAAQAAECIEACQPDLLLSDIGLPDASGNELLERVRGVWHGKAIAMSGHAMRQDILTSMRAGFDVHLVKPVSAEVLKEALTDLFPAAQPVA